MKPRISNQTSRALTLTELLVVIVVLAVLALFLLPAFYDGPVKAPRINCVNNLKQIGLAYYLWSEDHQGKFPMEISVTNGGTRELFSGGSQFQNLVFLNYLVMSNELSTPKILHCQADTNGFAAQNFSEGFNNQNMSYFAGLDAGTNFSQVFLSGDDNFEVAGVPVNSGVSIFSSNAPIAWTSARHKFAGNIGLSDGSVQQVTISGLTNLLHQTGLATNRLAIP